MDLLPKNVHGFTEKSYWDEFFSKSNSFEWYGEYLELCGVLHKYMRHSDRLLVVGCGNSKLSADLYDAGFVDNTNIDISGTVIKQMTEKYCLGRPSLKYLKMDSRQMSFESEHFGVILDKGTVDALLADASDDCKANVTLMMDEIQRVLKLGGRFICVSLLQAHVMEFLLHSATNNGWMIRIHSMLNSSLDSDKESIKALPVFVLVCTKMKIIPGMKQILEFCTSDQSSPERKDSTKALSECVLACQQYAFLCHKVNSKKFLTEEIAIDLHNASSPHPRYTVFVLDSSKKTSLKFAVFIVPQGRECEWLFCSPDGRRQLLETVNCQRLLVVHLSRHHQYKDLDEVKEELSQRANHFRPQGISSVHQSPFLSVEGHIGSRNVLFQGSSPTTGEYVIEDIVADAGARFRRLLFLSNQNVIQSEAKLKAVSSTNRKKKNKAKTTEFEVDHSFLACDHHKYMIAGLAFLPLKLLEAKVHILIIGLGGGGLPAYIQKFLPNIGMDVVDIDPVMVSISQQWFGLNPNTNMVLHVEDGLDFLINCEKSGKTYDVVMFDVNNSDTSTGLSVPPPAFIEESVLITTSKVLSTEGLFVLNLVCRNQHLKKDIYDKLKKVFQKIWFQHVPEELNEILYASNSPSKYESESIQSKSEFLNKTLRKNSFKNNLLDTTEMMKTLSVLT